MSSRLRRVVTLCSCLLPSIAAAESASLPPECRVPQTPQSAKPRIVIANFVVARSKGVVDETEQMLAELSKQLEARRHDVELTKANCAVANGAQARALAKAWNARLVLWSPAGAATAESLATIATLGPAGGRSAGNSKTLGTGAVDEFQLPTRRNSVPHLASFALGLQFLDRPGVAVKFFADAAAMLPFNPDVDLAPLYRAVGSAFLQVPGGPERLVQIGRNALSAAANSGTRAESQLLTNSGLAMAQQNRVDEALYNLNAALAIDLKREGEVSQAVADDLDNLARMHALAGDAQGGAESARKAIGILLKLHGKGDPRIAFPSTTLGVILTDAGFYPEGFKWLRRALILDTKTGLPWLIAQDLNNIGWNLAGQGRYDDAIATYRAALAQGVRVYPPDHPFIATCKGNLAWAISGHGDQDQAIALLRETISLVDKPDHSEDATLAAQLEHLGSALVKQEKFEAAREQYARSHAIFERVLGSEHPTTLWVQRKYARSIAAMSGWRQDKGTGAVVWKVEPSSPASHLGLRVGDWIVGYGTPVTSVPQLRKLADTAPSGQAVSFMRDGQTLTKTSVRGVEGAELYEPR